MPIMRQHPYTHSRPAMAVSLLLAVILPASLIAGGLAAADTADSEPGMAAAPAMPGGTGGGGRQTLRVAKQNPGTSPSYATSPATSPTFQSPLATPTPLNTTSPLAPKPDNSTEDKTADSQPQTRAATQYTIKFTDPEGGSTTPDQHVTKGIQAQRPDDPARPGYAFDGWFTDNVAYDFTQPVTKDTTLTAKWTKDWSISPVKGLTAGGTRVVLTPPPSRGIRFGHASAGNSNSAALGSDGSIYSWGGESGRDTSGLSANQPGIITPPAGIQKFTQVSAGNDYSLAVGSDGNIYSWGDNTTDQLGRDTSKAPANRPGIVIPPTTGIRFTQVSAGAWHALALDENGNIYSWGSNTKGALGRDNSTTPENRPGIVTSPTIGIRFTQVSAGTFFSLAIGTDGNLYSWGSNGNGRLGRTPSETTPADRPGIVDPPDGVTAFTQASAGGLFSLAIGSDGNLYSWGNNDSGQLGRDTSSTPENKPGKVSIPESDLNIIQASAGLSSAGLSYSLAVDSHGNLYSWGNNDSGQLGRDASSTPEKKPGKVPSLTDRVSFTQASAGVASSLAMGSDGNLYSWGNNDSGQLGRDTTKSSTTKPGVVDFPEKPKPTRVSFGDKAGANLTANTDGTWNVTTPAHPEGQVDVAISWTMNGQQPDTHLDYTYINSYTVTFDSAGGQQTPGQQIITIGKQATRPTASPARDGFLFDGWFLEDANGKSDVAYDFSQPVTADITLVAHWSPASTGGWSISPSKGNAMGGQQATITPPRLSRGIRFNQISASLDMGGFSVGVASDGNAYAWGDNEDGQLGQDPDKTPTQKTPVRVPLPDGVASGFTYTQVAAGGAHVVAIGSDQIVYAWGPTTRASSATAVRTHKTTPSPSPSRVRTARPSRPSRSAPAPPTRQPSTRRDASILGAASTTPPTHAARPNRPRPWPRTPTAPARGCTRSRSAPTGASSWPWARTAAYTRGDTTTTGSSATAQSQETTAKNMLPTQHACPTPRMPARPSKQSGSALETAMHWPSARTAPSGHGDTVPMPSSATAGMRIGQLPCKYGTPRTPARDSK